MAALKQIIWTIKRVARRRRRYKCKSPSADGFTFFDGDWLVFDKGAAFVRRSIARHGKKKIEAITENKSQNTWFVTSPSYY